VTLQESINRGFNVMVTAVLLFGGVAFGAVAFSPVENDWGDRLDDIGLPVIGITCLIWLLIGRHRFERSIIPLILAGVALGVQSLAIPLEHDDAAAFGDNLGGLIMLAPFFLFALVQYLTQTSTSPTGKKDHVR